MTKGTETTSRPSVEPTQYVKLPPFDLPDFSGDMHAFPEFWELFSVAIHNNNSVPTISKFLYLKGKLKGDALALIAPIQFSESNYHTAVQILRSTYMRPEVLRIRLFDQIEAVPPAKDTPMSQRTTLCTIKALWLQLEKLGEQPGTTGMILTIRSKFPHRTNDKVDDLKLVRDRDTECLGSRDPTAGGVKTTGSANITARICIPYPTPA
ncbi:unnamed protein product [Heligmosomoides polygyrus]|uniref:Uncharacterized protein n=1 Tax=Heligmosomoides polygyrus TaxID=6339 RepID=A0A183FBU9_HELPZ|nr:unnamed protein product [Heligmosomoides polygyrus]